mmetsp:Transcript_6488/g.14836  ORF Transcript_6488/g.14836 Transcript_6488/m.14836 type:complete len:103 (-) Transcript_6488:120-428(-)
MPFLHLFPGYMLADVTTNSFPNAHTGTWEHPPLAGHAGDVGDGTWGGTNPVLTWGWKGGKVDSGVYDNVLPDPDHHTWAPASAPVDPTQYQKEWLGNVVNIY